MQKQIDNGIRLLPAVFGIMCSVVVIRMSVVQNTSLRTQQKT